MDDASVIMRFLGVVAMISPFLLTRIPTLRPYARRGAVVATVIYIGFGIGFVVWYTLIRSSPPAGSG